MKKLSSLLLTSFLIVLFTETSVAQYFLENSKVPIIEQMTKNYKNKSLSIYELDQIVQELSSDGLFQIVYVELIGRNKVIIKAEQSIKFSKIQFEGNKSFDQEELYKAMELIEGKTYSQLEITQAINRITKLYENSGYYNFKITNQTKPTEDGAQLLITIDERGFCVIEDINIFSKNQRLNRLLNVQLKGYIKNNYQQGSSKAIEENITQYLLEHRFLTSHVVNSTATFNDLKTKVKLNFTISNPTQFEFIFHGNDFFSYFDLIKVSKVGGKFLYLSDSSSEIIESITDYYLNSGFPKISIRFSEKYFAKQNKKVLVFNIDEGPRINIGQIRISGKISKIKSYYSRLFKEYLAEQAHSVYYVHTDVENAANALLTHLKREGHLTAELLSLNASFDKYNNANIEIQIDEGILTYVRQILFRGSKSFSNIELREQVKIEPNKPLQIGQVEESFEKLSNFYKEKAFLEFKLKNPNSSVIQYEQGQPYADIVYQIKEGPKISVKDIIIKGNSKTKEYVINRELNFSKGETLTLSKLSRSIEQLEETGLFGKVNIKSLEQGSDLPKRTIIVEVEERRPGLFSSGIGVRNEGRLSYRGYLGMLYNNLGGKARGLSSRVDLRFQKDVNYLENRIALSYYESYLLKSRLRGRVSLVREQELSDFNENNLSDIRSTNQIRFSAEKEFSKKFRFTYNIWSFANQETFTVKTYESQGTVNIGSTGPVFELDYRNDPFLPTQGSYSRFDMEYADPILGGSRDRREISGTSPGSGTGSPIRNDTSNEINFFKTSFSTTFYTPLSKSRRWVWANSLRGGYVKNVSSRDDSGVPRVESFFLGGSSTIRGFTVGTTETVPGKRELCLNQSQIRYDQMTSDCKFDDIFVRDDSAFFLIKSELRFPISGKWGGLLFYDGGAVYLGEFSLQDPYRDSVGIGIRYDTPVGAFVVELGYKLDRKLGGLNTKYDRESDVAIHLSIGTF